MSAAAPVTAPNPPAVRVRGIPPLPLLTLINFFNYLDRQVVYGMTPHIQNTFQLSYARLGALASANLFVFAVASLISGPVADRVGPRKVIFAGILVWSVATIGSALSTSFPMLLFFRALVGVGEGAYGPSANTLLCADAPPEKRGRALGIYNIGMAIGGTSGLVLGTVLAPVVGWRGVFWIAGGPSVLLTILAAFIAAPDRLQREKALPARSYLLSAPYLLAVGGGVMATFGASALIFWVRTLIIEQRHVGTTFASIYMAFVGLVCGAGGVIVGGYMGDALNRRGRGGHALTIGISMLLATPMGILALTSSNIPVFLAFTAVASFLLSVYNGPAAAVIDELGPPRYAATLQAVSMFSLHVFGNTPAPWVVGRIMDKLHVPVSVGLQAAMVAFGLSALLFLILARKQRTMPSYH
jgi:MFS transporter, Spinster family, sphingosine-1-phosphate transporter